jgi:hypothetical protein
VVFIVHTATHPQKPTITDARRQIALCGFNGVNNSG